MDHIDGARLTRKACHYIFGSGPHVDVDRIESQLHAGGKERVHLDAVKVRRHEDLLITQTPEPGQKIDPVSAHVVVVDKRAVEWERR